MTLTAEERNAMISTRIEKSDQAFIEAKGNIHMRFWNTAANRLYCSCYNIMSALLLKAGHSAQSHKGVATLFALHVIKSSIIPKEIGKTYNQLFLLRQTVDYDDWNLIEEEDVTALIEPTEIRIQTIKTFGTIMYTVSCDYTTERKGCIFHFSRALTASTVGSALTFVFDPSPG
ncbi:MAG: HEPN domain-containing protein [Bacteroides sp.]|nr:HEPN domain-containing protein [Bacteroides sp.]